ncbi:helix-turn-helix transcriptional regulator [Corynebacterium alimapuense]|uniref:WYL domain-containing protein n=1 Tax=Corynebacterium alimapuense TaxID=1576874 RepID=A0A3M8K8P8_9CORY|nr:WYL domain-containing protein [Corynebacterium alimapuense]RNE49145.1 WYL domain-containing protein [Corynebacterium alimapuense]
MPRPIDSPAKLDTLVHLLNIIPYFQAHPERSVMEAAKDLGREPGALLADLHRLSCSGVGNWPEELVDLHADYRRVTISNSQGMDRPLRLTPTEAGVLLLTLESLEAMSGLTDRKAVISAAKKLREILDPKAVAVFDSLAAEDVAETSAQLVLRQALENNQRVNFNYRSVSSDTVRSRVVDPVRIFVNGGETYLTAWEESSGQHKHFRADRMSDMRALDEPSSPHLDQIPFDQHDPFSFLDIPEKAQLLMRAEATWLADYYPITLGRIREDSRVEASMPLGSTEWFIRFALGQADRLEVIGPAHLAQQVRLRTSIGLSTYNCLPDR